MKQLYEGINEIPRIKKFAVSMLESIKGKIDGEEELEKMMVRVGLSEDKVEKIMK